ncbi:auxin-responsive protein IAA2-like [Zingiber officinale]|nr:auxin-responsive protein IAA2-like [Zingiber officinale]XP_042466865.1 auxin-responsive protein IAA2-like [Zingiber officinale]
MEDDHESLGDACPQLLNLIQNEKVGKKRIGGLDASEEKKLELTLGLPGGVGEEENPFVLSSCIFSKVSKTSSGRGVLGSEQLEAGLFQLQSKGGYGTEWPHKTTWNREKFDEQQSLEKAHGGTENEAGSNTSFQTGVSAGAPVVGWPPIRAFRKNLASSSVKQSVELQNGNIDEKVKVASCKKGLLIKINMDGIPIGRKVDLNACGSYKKLSVAVESLFLDLLEAQKETSTNDLRMDEEAKQAFKSLLDGSGEYTLVYEDNEGDRMLVGDVPWDMFVSSVKRLRVLKSSDLSSLHDWEARKEQQLSVEYGDEGQAN